MKAKIAKKSGKARARPTTADRLRKNPLVRTEKSGGRNIKEVWHSLFSANEKNWKSGDKRMILLDEEISRKLHQAFPGRGSKVFDQVHVVRGWYNKGGYDKAPKTSHRYVRSNKGEVVRLEISQRLSQKFMDKLNDVKPPKGEVPGRGKKGKKGKKILLRKRTQGVVATGASATEQLS